MRSSSLFWGFILLLVGALLLLANLGIITVNIWNLLWPLFLVAIGVWMLLGTLFRGQSTRKNARVALEGARRARLRIQHGAGRLDVGAGAEGEDLLVGDLHSEFDIRTRRDGDLLDVKLSMQNQFFPFFWLPGHSLDWILQLNPDVLLALDFETGAGEARINLSDLQVTDVRLKSGASSTNLTLPANAGETRVKVEAGAASVNIRVPDGVAARVRMDGALSSLNVDQRRFLRDGGVYQSSDYHSSTNKAEIHIEMGVGSVSVR